MSLRLLLDEDSQAKLLVERLKAAGHDVITVGDIGLMGRPDVDVLRAAEDSDRVLMTRNCADFRALHATFPTHTGIIGVYQDRDPARCLTYEAIVQSISHLEEYAVRAQWPIAGEFVVLNAWTQAVSTGA